MTFLLVFWITFSYWHSCFSFIGWTAIVFPFFCPCYISLHLLLTVLITTGLFFFIFKNESIPSIYFFQIIDIVLRHLWSHNAESPTKYIILRKLIVRETFIKPWHDFHHEELKRYWRASIRLHFSSIYLLSSTDSFWIWV